MLDRENSGSRGLNRMIANLRGSTLWHLASIIKRASTGTRRRQSLVAVSDLLRKYTPEELNQAAEAYFASIKNWDCHLAKPFASIEETPELLTYFAQVLSGLHLERGMTILDFAAGSCWSSRYLCQLGMKTIAMDVSVTALAIGRELFARNPVFGNCPPLDFMRFDGRQF